MQLWVWTKTELLGGLYDILEEGLSIREMVACMHALEEEERGFGFSFVPRGKNSS